MLRLRFSFYNHANHNTKLCCHDHSIGKADNCKKHFQNVNTRVSFENLQKQRNFDVRIHEVGFLLFISFLLLLEAPS